MTQVSRMEIHELFSHPLFFDKTFIEFESDNYKEENVGSVLFLFDMAFALGLDEYKPWNNEIVSVELLMKKWEANKSELQLLFEDRNRALARPLMVQSIGYFMMSLFWSNHRPVTSLVNWESYVLELSIQPVNCLERFKFVFQNPDHFQSFIQLTQLFDELNKQFKLSLIRRQNPM